MVSSHGHKGCSDLGRHSGMFRLVCAWQPCTLGSTASTHELGLLPSVANLSHVARTGLDSPSDLTTAQCQCYNCLTETPPETLFHLWIHLCVLFTTQVGGTVGYRVRLESRVSAGTRVEVVTEGLLLRRLQVGEGQRSARQHTCP